MRKFHLFQEEVRKLKEKNHYWQWGLTIFLTACAILLFYDTVYQAGIGGTVKTFFQKVGSVLAPVVYGAVMAYLLAPVVNWFERIITKLWGKNQRTRNKTLKHGKTWLRAAAILLTWAIVLVLIYLLMSVLIPQLVDSVTLLVKNAKDYYARIYEWVDTWLTNTPEIGVWANEMLADSYSNALDVLTQKVLPWASTMATNLGGGIWSGIWSIVTFAKNIIIGLIISIYLLAMKEKSLARCCKALYALCKKETADLIVQGTRRTNQIFSGFVIGKIIDSIIIGILCFVGCSVLKIPYTPLVSVVVGVTNVIPFFGPFLGAIPSMLLILLVSPRKCLIFGIFVLLLQQFDGNILGPKILGGSTGISSFWVIVAILVGGGFFGVLGMFLGVPVFACLQALCKWLMDNRLRKRGMPTEAREYVKLKDASKEKKE